ncbi:MAG: AAA family ATPase, partial [Thermomicrobiaceae bacterium]|nr:AAA family ATPase [Thermomicrobiaceae bacterium]
MRPREGACPAAGRPVRLVGRGAELAALEQARAAASRGTGALVLVGGEPGIGKTALVEAFTAARAAAGDLALTGRCYEMGGVPFGPWAEALRGLARCRPEAIAAALGPGRSADLAPLLPDLRAWEPRSEQSPGEARLRLFDAVTRLLTRASEERPLILALDDLHWADEASVQLLAYVVRTAREARLLVVGTYRDVELEPRHPLEAAMVDLARERLATRLLLRRLDLGETTEMVADLLGARLGEVAPGLAEAIQAEAEGVPFFIEELVVHLREERLLRREGGAWRLAPGAVHAVPQSVRSVVGRRLARLDPASQETLAVAAVIGKEFGLDLLARVRGAREPATLARHLEEALRRGLIVERPPARPAEAAPRYAFAHEQIREVLYRGLGQVRQRLLHQRVAEALEALRGPDDPLAWADLARHYGAGEDLRRAARFAALAGRRAAELRAPEEALRYLGEALEILESLGGRGGDERAWLRERFDLLAAREAAADALRDRVVQG